MDKSHPSSTLAYLHNSVTFFFRPQRVDHAAIQDSCMAILLSKTWHTYEILVHGLSFKLLWCHSILSITGGTKLAGTLCSWTQHVIQSRQLTVLFLPCLSTGRDVCNSHALSPGILGAYRPRAPEDNQGSRGSRRESPRGASGYQSWLDFVPSDVLNS